MKRIARNSNKKDFDSYGRNEANVEVGAGPLRPRINRKMSEGDCLSCGVFDERLADGICPFCMSMINDTEAGEG